MRKQDRTLEREHSIYGFLKQVNMVERTWNDDLRAMSHGLGIAIVISCDRTKRDFANGLSRLECCERTPCERPRGRAADERDEIAPLHVEHGDPYALSAPRTAPVGPFITAHSACRRTRQVLGADLNPRPLDGNARIDQFAARRNLDHLLACRLFVAP